MNDHEQGQDFSLRLKWQHCNGSLETIFYALFEDLSAWRKTSSSTKQTVHRSRQ